MLKSFAFIETRFAYKYKKPTANSYGKFLRHILTANSHGKFLRQILAANSHGKFLRQIPARKFKTNNKAKVY